MEVFKYNKLINDNYKKKYNTSLYEHITNKLNKSKRNSLIEYVVYINGLVKKHNLTYPKICHSGKRLSYMIDGILSLEKIYR